MTGFGPLLSADRPTAQRDGWRYGVLRTFKVVAALGRSFASGSGIELVADTGVMRSAKNYAHQIAERLEAELVDRSAAGPPRPTSSTRLSRARTIPSSRRRSPNYRQTLTRSR